MQTDDMAVTQIRIEQYPQPSTSFPSSLDTDYAQSFMLYHADSIIKLTLYLPRTLHAQAWTRFHTHTHKESIMK
jgi:hypothetical protein